MGGGEAMQFAGNHALQHNLLCEMLYILNNHSHISPKAYKSAKQCLVHFFLKHFTTKKACVVASLALPEGGVQDYPTSGAPRPFAGGQKLQFSQFWSHSAGWQH